MINAELCLPCAFILAHQRPNCHCGFAFFRYASGILRGPVEKRRPRNDVNTSRLCDHHTMKTGVWGFGLKRIGSNHLIANEYISCDNKTTGKVSLIMASALEQFHTDEKGVIRRKYQFYGRVQGVGFRYTAVHAARRLGVTGWVRNEYDGSVTVEAQGTRFELDELLRMIRDGRFIGIDRIETTELAVDEEERSFQAY